MRYAVLSDINGNQQALDAVLAHARTWNVDEIVFLGDAIGYGGNSIECFETMRKVADTYLLGNFESKLIDQGQRKSHPWHTRELQMLHMRFAGERETWLRDRNRCLLRPPFSFAYNIEADPQRKPSGLPSLTSQLHSGDKSALTGIHITSGNHSPWIVTSAGTGYTEKECDFEFRFDSESAYVVGIGSVGQPRDGDWRACYAIVDQCSIRWRRIEYDIDTAMTAITSNLDLNDSNAQRLQFGY